MRFISILLVAAATAVAAQDLGTLVAQIPACAFSCLEQASKSLGCTLTDYKCMCRNTAQTESAATTCLTNSCQVGEISSEFFFFPLSLSPSSTAPPSCFSVYYATTKTDERDIYQKKTEVASLTADICKAVAGTSGTASTTANAGGATTPAPTVSAPAGNATSTGGGGAAGTATGTGTAPVRAGAGRPVSVAAVGVAGLAVVAAAALAV